MFKVKAPETFGTTLTIVGQGREQKLKLTYRHLLKDAYMALMDKLAAGEITPAQAVLELVAEWDADVDLDTDGVETALQHQIGLDTAIIHGYAQAIQVARKGNGQRRWGRCTGAPPPRPSSQAPASRPSTSPRPRLSCGRSAPCRSRSIRGSPPSGAAAPGA